MHIWPAGGKSALGRAWRIEFLYRNILEYKARSKGRAREAASRTRPFDRAQYSRIFLYENSIPHAYPKCTFASGWPNMFVLIYMLDLKYIANKDTSNTV